MSETTQIHPDKVRAYLATDYRLGHTEHDIILNIGVRSERVPNATIQVSRPSSAISIHIQRNRQLVCAITPHSLSSKSSGTA